MENIINGNNKLFAERSTSTRYSPERCCLVWPASDPGDATGSSATLARNGSCGSPSSGNSKYRQRNAGRDKEHPGAASQNSAHFTFPAICWSRRLLPQTGHTPIEDFRTMSLCEADDDLFGGSPCDL